jgi:hypothetical protein
MPGRQVGQSPQADGREWTRKGLGDHTAVCSPSPPRLAQGGALGQCIPWPWPPALPVAFTRGTAKAVNTDRTTMATAMAVKTVG